MKYNVHAFEIVRVKVPDVEAENHSDAIAKALESYDVYKLFDGERDGLEIESAEEVSHFLVDEISDEECRNSRWYMSDTQTLMPSGYYSPLQVIAAMQAMLDEYESAHPELKELWETMAKLVRS